MSNKRRSGRIARNVITHPIASHTLYFMYPSSVMCRSLQFSNRCRTLRALDSVSMYCVSYESRKRQQLFSSFSLSFLFHPKKIKKTNNIHWYYNSKCTPFHREKSEAFVRENVSTSCAQNPLVVYYIPKAFGMVVSYHVNRNKRAKKARIIIEEESMYKAIAKERKRCKEIRWKISLFNCFDSDETLSKSYVKSSKRQMHRKRSYWQEYLIRFSTEKKRI